MSVQSVGIASTVQFPTVGSEGASAKPEEHANRQIVLMGADRSFEIDRTAPERFHIGD